MSAWWQTQHAVASTLWVAEALHRISRDQEHVALFLQDDAVSADRHPGGRRNLSPARRAERLKGTMNAIFLQDLRQKVHRGQEVLFCRVQAPAA
jgi:hypothetical protein